MTENTNKIKMPKSRKKKKRKPDDPFESSVRLSEPIRKKYDVMALADYGQKTEVIHFSIHQLAQALLGNPRAFQGDSRPWLAHAAGEQRPTGDRRGSRDINSPAA